MHKTRGLSIIEMLSTLIILGILFTFIASGMHSTIQESRRTQAVTYVRTIVHAYQQFIHDHGRCIQHKDISSLCTENNHLTPSVHLIAAALEKYGYISDVSTWCWDFDPAVINYKKQHATKNFSYFYNQKQTGKELNADIIPACPLSVICAVIEDEETDIRLLLGKRIPIVISRGMQSTGLWRSKSASNNSGIWGTNGGIVGYLNGEVEWCKDTYSRFSCFGEDGHTSDANEAIPNKQDYTPGSFSGSDFLGNNGYGAIGY